MPTLSKKSLTRFNPLASVDCWWGEVSHLQIPVQPLEALEGDVLGRGCVCKVRCKQQYQGEEDHNFPGGIPEQIESS